MSPTLPARSANGAAAWRGGLVTLAALLLAMACGRLAADSPSAALALVVLGVGVPAIALRPSLGAYLLLATTPLLAGIGRGSLVPFLRPGEVVLALVAGALALRTIVLLVRGDAWRPRLTAVDAMVVLLALAGSLVPLLLMAARGREISGDDLQFATYLWKYAAVFFVVRASVRTEREVRTCLAIVLVMTAVVGVVALLQALQVDAVTRVLATLYAEGEGQDLIDGDRGTSTLSSSFAVADIMAFGLAVAAAGWLYGQAPRALMAVFALVFLVGVVAAGQFSGLVGLAVALVATGLVTRRLGRLLLVAVPTAALAGLALWPLVLRRLDDFETLAGLPASWAGPHGRWSNLSTFFWPRLAEDDNWLTGVQIAPRVQSPELWRDWVWIESGHTWLLWTGGIPFFLACMAFFAVAMVAVQRVARARRDAIGVAAVGSLAALAVNFVLLTFDVHLTMRGAADLTFALLALALVGAAGAGAPARRSASP